jgi:hypothetical protein
MDNTQLTTLCAAIFMSGPNPLAPEAAAEKARDLVKAMSFAISFADDTPQYTEDTPTRTETMETRRVYFD